MKKRPLKGDLQLLSETRTRDCPEQPRRVRHTSSPFSLLQMSSAFLLRRVCASSFRSFNVISSRLTSTSGPSTTTDATSIDPQFKKKIDEFVHANKIAIFIKGEPDAPRCGFSNAVLQILNLHGCDFRSKNILEDDQLRQMMKIYR